MKIKVYNSLCYLEFNPDKFTPFAKETICKDLFKVLSYQKGEAPHLRNVMKKKYSDAKMLGKQLGINGLKAQRPELFKYYFLKPEMLDEWIRKATMVYLFDCSTNTFPTGLLSRVEAYFTQLNLAYTLDDKRHEPESNYYFQKTQPLPELRYYQKAVLEKTKIYPRGIIEAATGTGKTLIIKELIAQKNVKTLVVVPSSNILDIFEEQLTDLFSKRFVGVVTGGKKQTDKAITIATYQSLPSMPPEWFQGFDMLITDEFHHSAADTLYELNIKQFKDIYYRYGFTATNYRNDSSEMSLEAVMSSVIHEYDFTTAINDGFLSPINFIIYNYENPNLRNTWREENKEALVQNEEFNAKVAEIAVKLDTNNIPTIIFVNEIEHGELLQQMIPNSEFITGKWKRKVNKDILTRFNNRQFNILIGTSVIGEGVDTVPAKVGILASGFKADSEVVQKIGRLLRRHDEKKNATFIDFTNSGTKYLNRHFKVRLDIYKRYGGEIIYKPF